MVSKPVLNLSTYYYNLFKLFGFTMMGIGFAGVLYLSITSVKWLHAILGNPVFKKMGRISYSFYLLHPLVYPFVAGYVIDLMPTGILAPIITTVISAVILYPVSLLSYNLLEKPFLSIGNLTTK
jgi:peptidoglycan/LPS O-acetylase OafA/YrhL